MQVGMLGAAINKSAGLDCGLDCMSDVCGLCQQVVDLKAELCRHGVAPAASELFLDASPPLVLSVWCSIMLHDVPISLATLLACHRKHRTFPLGAY